MRRTGMQTSETFLLNAILSLSGGFQDAYTYNLRNKVFANAQTGNVVLMSQHFLMKDWGAGAHYLFPVLAFACGILAAEQVGHRYRSCERVHWRQIVLLIEILVLTEACADISQRALHLNVVDLFVLQRAVLQLCEVDDVIVVRRGEEINVAVVVNNDDTFGFITEVDEIDGDIVELAHPIESGDALVIGVVSHQLALHQGINAMPDRDITCADGIGRIDLPRTNLLGLR